MGLQREIWEFVRRRVAYAIPLLVGITAWEIYVRDDPRLLFLFASPSRVLSRLLEDLYRGELLHDFFITGLETISGLVIGASIGSVVGLSLWLSLPLARMARPYVLAAGATPIFAIAPMMVIWFGTGLFSKIMMAAISTLFIAVVQAYEGARNTDAEMIALVRAFGGGQLSVFRKVVIPSSLVWVVVACRLNIGFALLGAFIGEFISSNQGLGHYILKASGLYDVPRVLAGVFLMIALVAVLSGLLAIFERLVLPWRFHRLREA